MSDGSITANAIRPLERFADPDWTARGEPRASVGLDRLETLWFNTGTLCNITCQNCYIESSPTNDRLVYLTTAEVRAYIDEIVAGRLGTREIGFTGGEPFMNPDCIGMLSCALEAGFDVLVLTNAMQPMMRPKVKKGLLQLLAAHGDRLTLRISLDHYTQALHEAERGSKSFAKAVEGLDWLNNNGFKIAIAGRTCWHEDEATSKKGYTDLIAHHGWCVDVRDTTALVLLPEMDGSREVPEISTGCWSILGRSPSEMMCATSRMIVKRKGAAAPTVVPCTLLPYDTDFDMGHTLTEAAVSDGGMFDNGQVKLCHPHCAKFCVLGGGSCS